ncbi:hypothetical protein RP20_CCG000692 [Aedes albopictus]|nr:hypothetical protein RP20_CCG000692 [Aedes albopictus]
MGFSGFRESDVTRGNGAFSSSAVAGRLDYCPQSELLQRYRSSASGVGSRSDESRSLTRRMDRIIRSEEDLIGRQKRETRSQPNRLPSSAIRVPSDPTAGVKDVRNR